MHRARCFYWLGWLDSNQRMRESKSRALPLGYTPSLRFQRAKGRSGRSGPSALRTYGVDDGTRTRDTWNHNPVLYQLNYIHHMRLRNLTRLKWRHVGRSKSLTKKGKPDSRKRLEALVTIRLFNVVRFKVLARLKGLEPLTHCLEGSCSIHLSYRRVWSG